MNDWNFEATGDSEPGTVAPRIPRRRQLILHACTGACDQGRRWCVNPARCQRSLTVRVLGHLKGAVVAAALVWLVCALVLLLWSR